MPQTLPATFLLSDMVLLYTDLDGLARFRLAYPDIQVARLCDTPDAGEEARSLALGACACLPLTLSSAEMLAALGQSVSREYKLTRRERDVLEYLCQGLSNRAIAEKLQLQIVTIKLHVRGICRKLGADNRTQAALLAQRLGLVSSQR